MRHNESRLNVVGVATGVQRVPPSWLLLHTATALATLGSPPGPAASVVEFSAARYAVVESSSTLSITVKRRDLDSAASVDYFTADTPGEVRCIAIQPDGKILIGGSGPAVDSPWCDRCPGHLSSMALQPDGTLLLAGNFTHFNDVPRAGLVRLDSMPRPVIASATRTADGRFLITVRGKPAQPYQIEFSTDLVTWTLLREVFSSGAMVEITDREASLLGHGFYRVRHR